jgi:ribosomal protein S14
VLTENQRVHQELVPDMSGTSHEGIHRCDRCGELTSKWDEPLSGVIIKKRKYDLSITYDGILISSELFKSVYTVSNLSGLEFRQLPDDTQFFAIHATRAIEFDAERRKTRFINPCQSCGRYESVVGATPVFLKAGSEVDEREFVRTDLEFGSGDEKHPLLICGKAAAKAICDAKLKGLDLIPIEGNARSNA